VTAKQQTNSQAHLPNVPVQPKKERDAKIELPNQMEDAIYINNFKEISTMNTTYLFALDTNTEEVLISQSAKGTIKIDFIEKISRTENEILYNAVVTLTSVSQDPNLDVAIFKASDKLCQMIYAKHCLSK